MARKVETAPWRRTYPWDRWLDGDPWLLEPGDFTGTPQTFSMTVRAEAIRRGGRARCRTEGNRVYIQFVPPVRDL